MVRGHGRLAGGAPLFQARDGCQKYAVAVDRIEGIGMQGWLLLILAIILEVAGTTCMKLSMGFSRLIPSIFIFFFYGLSFAVLAYSLKKIDLSVAYAAWSGIGTGLIAIIGFVYFEEQVTLLRLAGIMLIILGVIGINLGSVKH